MWLVCSNFGRKMNMEKERLTGSWELLSWHSLFDDKIEYPYGKNLSGLLTYTQNDIVMVSIMSLGCDAFLSEDIMQATLTEKAAAFSHYISYFGTFEIDDIHQIVSHRITGASFPNWVGSMQKRAYQLAGNLLTLQSEYMDNSVQILKWRKCR